MCGIVGTGYTLYLDKLNQQASTSVFGQLTSPTHRKRGHVSLLVDWCVLTGTEAGSFGGKIEGRIYGTDATVQANASLPC